MVPEGKSIDLSASSSTTEIHRGDGRGTLAVHAALSTARCEAGADTRCTVCTLHDGSLLDAAHIVPDGEGAVRAAPSRTVHTHQRGPSSRG